MKLWSKIKVQGALALFVTAAFTQLAHAGLRPDDRAVGPRAAAVQHAATRPDNRAVGSRVSVLPGSSLPSQQARKALGDRWNAIAAAYGAGTARSYSSAAHLRATTDPFQARLHKALGELDYQPGVTDVPAATPSAGPATTGYVVGGQLIQPDEHYQPLIADVPAATLSAGPAATRPDDRAGIRGIDDRPAIVVTGGSFDWNDAGIGAAGAFGTCLLLVACAAFAANRKHKPAVL